VGSKPIFIVGLAYAFIAVVPGCANLIGLGDFSAAGGSATSAAGSGNHAGASTIAEAGSGADAGADAGSGAEGGSSGASTGGTNSSAGAAGTAGVACPSNCDDQNDCTDDSCVAGACKNQPLAAGVACGTGRTCDDNAVCVRCRDTAAGNGRDEGCTAGAPACMGTGTAATCAGCTKDADCDDGNDCTTEKCSAGSCAFTPVAAGQACATGVCNGTANAEKCVACTDNAVAPSKDLGCSDAKPACDTSGTPACYECAKDADCSDGVSCTDDTCTNHACVHVADDSKCAASGDVCVPNKCDATVSCKPVDISMPTPLVAADSAQGNGSFEDGTGKSKVAGSGTATGWEDVGDDPVIYNCVGTPPSTGGCLGSAATTFMANKADGNLLAWFAGTGYATVDELQRLVHLPPGTTAILIQADTNLQTQSTAPSNSDSFDVRLLDSSHTQVGAAVVTLSNTTAQTASANWTLDGISKSVDISAPLGKDIYLSLRATVDATLKTDFFIDNVRVTATVCK
jgi:hypothetical protein